jgi:hypothetical protein
MISPQKYESRVDYFRSFFQWIKENTMTTQPRLVSQSSSHYKVHSIAIGSTKLTPNADGSVTVTKQQFETWTNETITNGDTLIKEHAKCNRRWKIALCCVLIPCASAIVGLAIAYSKCRESGQ